MHTHSEETSTNWFCEATVPTRSIVSVIQTETRAETQQIDLATGPGPRRDYHLY